MSGRIHGGKAVKHWNLASSAIVGLFIYGIIFMKILSPKKAVETMADMAANMDKGKMPELTIIGQAPEEFKDASVFAQFDTPTENTSEEYGKL